MCEVCESVCVFVFLINLFIDCLSQLIEFATGMAPSTHNPVKLCTRFYFSLTVRVSYVITSTLFGAIAETIVAPAGPQAAEEEE